MIAMWAVITTHERPEMLKRAVDKALNQSLQGLVVAVDGWESDTLAYLEGIADPRLSVVCIPKARGSGAVRAAGTALTPFDCAVLKHDDDDYLEPGAVEAFRCEFEQGAGLVYSDVRWIDPAGAPLPNPWIAEGYSRGMFRNQRNLCCAIWGFRKSAYSAVGGWRCDEHVAEDYALALRIESHLQDTHIHYIPKILSAATRGGAKSISDRWPEKQQEYSRLLQKAAQEDRLYERVLPNPEPIRKWYEGSPTRVSLGEVNDFAGAIA